MGDFLWIMTLILKLILTTEALISSDRASVVCPNSDPLSPVQGDDQLTEPYTLIRLAVILPGNNSRLFSIDRTAPAIDLAIDKVNASGLIPSIRFEVNYNASNCRGTAAPLAAFHFYMEKKVDIFFGPACEYSLAPVSRYVSHWNIPVVSAGGMAHDFADKNEFGTLTRVGVTFDSLYRAVSKMFEYYSWKSVAVLYDSNALSDVTPRFCYLTISAFVSNFKKEKFAHNFHLFSKDGINITKVLMHEVGNYFGGKYIYA